MTMFCPPTSSLGWGEEALNIAIRELWDPVEPYFIIYTLIWVIKLTNMDKIKWHCFIRAFGGSWRPWVDRFFLTHVMT